MKFSITIPAYKTRFLRECIDSVLTQTYTDFEVIILNDASPEDVEGVVSSFSDSRIRYYKNEQNVGAVNLVDNWNKCLELAKGDYIICMGDDDRLMPDCLEQYARMIEKYPEVDLFHARTLRINENGEPIAVSQGYSEYERVFQFMLHRLNYGIQFIGDFCYRSSVLRQIGGYFKLPMAWGSDYISSYLAAARNGIVNIDKPLFCYRTNSLTISNTGNAEIKLHSLRKEMIWYNQFLERECVCDIVELLSQQEIKQRYQSYFMKSKARIISHDIARKNTRLLYWLLNRKKNGITFKELFLAVYYSRRP